MPPSSFVTKFSDSVRDEEKFGDVYYTATNFDEVAAGKLEIAVEKVWVGNFNIMAKRLYIGNLSFDTSDEGLREAFSQAGEVTSATVMKDKMTGRSRGFGFVEMATDEGAASAIEMWNGKELDGRTLTVNEARPMTERPPRRPGGGFGGGFGRGPRTYSSRE